MITTGSLSSAGGLTTVICQITPTLLLRRFTDFSPNGGFRAAGIDLKLPSQLWGSVMVPGGAVDLPASGAWVGRFAAGASTPVSLDLTALVGGQGDTAFTLIRAIDIRSLEAAGSGRILTVGASGGSTEFYDPIGDAAGAKLVIPPGTGRQLYTLETGGWAVGTRKILKLDPGSNPHSFLIAIAGDV